MGSASNTLTRWCMALPPPFSRRTSFRRSNWPTSECWRRAMNTQPAELILHNGKIATQDDRRSLLEAAAISDGRFLAVGSDREMMRLRDERTKLIDLNKRTVIPGLNDSHTHLIRGGLNYNLELRWDGVPSLADGLRMLREQARRTPSGQWVRVVGGWSEFQFAERRMPTLDELNKAAPDTPVFVLHLYDRALLNRAALRAVGYTRDSAIPWCSRLPVVRRDSTALDHKDEAQTLVCPARPCLTRPASACAARRIETQTSRPPPGPIVQMGFSEPALATFSNRPRATARHPSELPDCS